MAKEKSLVEEAIIQMKNLEEAVAENAKGILASTMKQEINELVKESLSEQDVEDEIETEINIDEPEFDDESEEESEEESDEESDEEGMEMDMDNIDVEEPIDLTDASDEEVLRVFQLMGPEDDVIVKKDDSGNINLKDNKTSKEYMIVGESDEESYFDDEEFEDEESEEDFENFEDEESEDEFNESIENIVKKVFDGNDEEESEEFNEGDVVYEIEFNEEEEEEEMEEEGSVMESKGKFMTSPKTGKNVSTGSPSEFKYKKSKGGFKEKMKQGTKGVGMGKAKFEFKEEAEIEEPKKLKNVSKEETKEASRTLGSGRRFGRAGLDKPKAAPRHLYKESEDAKELQILREKNEEYRKALNVFRQKLNEVAVFNSNLAYATRLFTEHTTSKQEKINILRRFDSIESIKESKNLYKIIIRIRSCW